MVQIVTRLRGYNPFEVFFELALIWMVVFLVWRFLRGTRGARVLKGFALVAVLVGLAAAILPGELFVRLRFLLDKVLIGATLALMIVFQPELRRALVRIGEARLFRGNAMQMESVIEQIVRAVEDMAKSKIGALIAIEREVGLAGVVELGTRLDANVSAELLKTIFWPGTALHDMAVVVGGDRIIAAGVQLPLAEGDDIEQELGSRHRAALGMSQEADCLIIVVSEETGAISLAERGQLLRKLSIDGLRSMLKRGLNIGPTLVGADDAPADSGSPAAAVDDEEPEPGQGGSKSAA